MNRLSRNVSVILSPEEGYSLLQVRDDVEGNPLQFFGGWMKGFYPEYEESAKEESVEQTIYREMIDELGLSLREIFFLPFPNMDDYTLRRDNGQNSIVYLTKAVIKPEWIGNKKKVERNEEVQGKLNLREGSSMDVFKLEESLLKQNLYPNDRRIFGIYLRNKDEMEQSAFKLSLENLYLPDKKRLEKLIRVWA